MHVFHVIKQRCTGVNTTSMTKDILRVFSAMCSFFPVQARWPSWTSICRQWLMSPLVDLTLLREWCCFQCTSKELGTVGLGLKWFFPLFHLEHLSKLYALSEALAISGYMVYTMMYSTFLDKQHNVLLQEYRRKEPLAWASGRWYDVNGALNLPKVWQCGRKSRNFQWIDI